MNFPYGGQDIASLRAMRKRPADMVLVSLVGPIRRESNPVVMARPEKPYDWHFLTGLDVLIVASTQLDASLVKRAADAIMDVRPGYLGVWFADCQNGLNLAFGSWKPKTKTCRMMGVHERRQLDGIGRISL